MPKNKQIIYFTAELYAGIGVGNCYQGYQTFVKYLNDELNDEKNDKLFIDIYHSKRVSNSQINLLSGEGNNKAPICLTPEKDTYYRNSNTVKYMPAYSKLNSALQEVGGHGRCERRIFWVMFECLYEDMKPIKWMTDSTIEVPLSQIMRVSCGVTHCDNFTPSENKREFSSSNASAFFQNGVEPKYFYPNNNTKYFAEFSNQWVEINPRLYKYVIRDKKQSKDAQVTTVEAPGLEMVRLK